MRSKGVLVVQEESEQTKEIVEKITESGMFSRVMCCHDGYEAIKLIMREKPDLVILDVITQGIDGYGIMKRFTDKGKPKFFVLTAMGSDIHIKKAVTYGAQYYMLKPVDLDQLLVAIGEVLNPLVVEEPSVKRKSRSVDEKISNIFISVGIPAHIKGYQYLREGIKLAIDNPLIINSITKELYPQIAMRYETSASKVERAIRHAIDVAWSRGKIENINTLFGVRVYTNNEKPTNGEFIALLADKMILEGM
ncbi:MAG: sporulation transcription factor Spo0A [Clostridia bacterium]|nr:sporulation transcription factor Spo0A [Clostridia bacterium]